MGPSHYFLQMSAGKKVAVVGLLGVAVVAALAPVLGVQRFYPDKDWGAIQDALTGSKFFDFGKPKKPPPAAESSR